MGTMIFFLEDLSVRRGQLFLGKDDATFVSSPTQPWKLDSLCEDIDALFFDADKDGDEDLLRGEWG
jgi:hypothetical protein